MKKVIGSVLSLIVIFIGVNLIFGIGQAWQDAAYQPIATDDPRLALNGGECEVIMTFPEGTSMDDKEAEVTLFLVKSTNPTQHYRWYSLPDGNFCISRSSQTKQP